MQYVAKVKRFIPEIDRTCCKKLPVEWEMDPTCRGPV